MLIFYSIFPSKFLLVFNLTVGKFMGVGKLGNLHRIDRATIRYYIVHLKKLQYENLVFFYRSEVLVKTKTLYYLKS